MTDTTVSRKIELQRITQIAYEHLLYAQRHPEILAELAHRLSISPQQAIAVAIADQVCEEFALQGK